MSNSTGSSWWQKSYDAVKSVAEAAAEVAGKGISAVGKGVNTKLVAGISPAALGLSGLFMGIIAYALSPEKLDQNGRPTGQADIGLLQIIPSLLILPFMAKVMQNTLDQSSSPTQVANNQGNVQQTGTTNASLGLLTPSSSPQIPAGDKSLDI